MKTKLFSIFVFSILCFGCGKQTYVSAVVKEVRTSEVAAEMIGCSFIADVEDSNITLVFAKWETCMIHCSLLRAGDQIAISKYSEDGQPSFFSWLCLSRH